MDIQNVSVRLETFEQIVQAHLLGQSIYQTDLDNIQKETIMLMYLAYVFGGWAIGAAITYIVTKVYMVVTGDKDPFGFISEDSSVSAGIVVWPMVWCCGALVAVIVLFIQFHKRVLLNIDRWFTKAISVIVGRKA
jgi:hypothetical protein